MVIACLGNRARLSVLATQPSCTARGSRAANLQTSQSSGHCHRPTLCYTAHLIPQAVFQQARARGLIDCRHRVLVETGHRAVNRPDNLRVVRVPVDIHSTNICSLVPPSPDPRNHPRRKTRSSRRSPTRSHHLPPTRPRSLVLRTCGTKSITTLKLRRRSYLLNPSPSRRRSLSR